LFSSILSRHFKELPTKNGLLKTFFGSKWFGLFQPSIFLLSFQSFLFLNKKQKGFSLQSGLGSNSFIANLCQKTLSNKN